MNARYNQNGERIRFDGFRVFRLEDEEFLFYRLGARALHDVYNLAFEYACVDAEYLRMRKRGPEFNELCEYHRTLMVKSVSDMVEKFDKEKGDHDHLFLVQDKTSNEIREEIEKRHEHARFR